ncbi:hypothetical protein NL676_035509 [Syzygium grande]|nr:hypothetical protein NL676_035509 [Syzygium grande]
MATELKVLNLSNCPSLKRTLDLSTFESLEILNLEGCSELQEIHPSLGDIKTLVSLNVKHCIRLKELPAGEGGGNLEAAIERLVNMEKQMRLAGNITGTKKAVMEILQLCSEAKAWKTRNDQIVLLSK